MKAGDLTQMNLKVKNEGRGTSGKKNKWNKCLHLISNPRRYMALRH